MWLTDWLCCVCVRAVNFNDDGFEEEMSRWLIDVMITSQFWLTNGRRWKIKKKEKGSDGATRPPPLVHHSWFDRWWQQAGPGLRRTEGRTADRVEGGSLALCYCCCCCLCLRFTTTLDDDNIESGDGKEEKRKKNHPATSGNVMMLMLMMMRILLHFYRMYSVDCTRW
jgi:hypothetical protein